MTAINNEEPSIWGIAGTAAWQGARDGLMLDTPETFYRAARTVGDMFGSKDIQSWAGEGIDDIKRARAEDPFYKVDEDVMESYLGRSIYGGLASTVSNLTMGGALALGGMVTGGLAPAALFSLLHGGAYGLAEYDSFIDETYETFKKVNPDLTWQQVQDQYNSEAVWSAVAEGGFEAAGDLILGGLLRNGGKAVQGTVKTAIGNETQKAWRTQVAKTLNGIFIKGPAAEMPTEMATQWVQTEMRNQAGITDQTVGEALKEAFGSTYISSMLLGGGGAIAEHGLNKGKREAEQAQYDAELAAKKAERETQREEFANNPVIQSVIGDGTPEGMLEAIGKQANETIEAEGIPDTSVERPTVPVNLNPESKEFKTYLETPLEEFDLFTSPMEKRGIKGAKILKTIGDLYQIYNECKAGKYKKLEGKGYLWQLGTVSKEVAQSLKSTLNIDIEGKPIVLTHEHLNHIINRHDKDGKKNNYRVFLSPEQFALLPSFITNPNIKPEFVYKRNKEHETDKHGNKKFKYKGNIGNDVFYAVEVSTEQGDSRVEINSFYPEVNNDLRNTSPSAGETGGSMPSSEEPAPSSRLSIPQSGSQLHSTDGDNINSTTEPPLVNNLLGYGEKIVKYLKGESQELTAGEAALFEKTKKKMSTDMTNAHKLGVVNKTQMARFFDLLALGEPKREISVEEHRAMVERQLAFDRGEIDMKSINMDTVNSSLLNPDFADDDFRNAHMSILGEFAEKIKNKDKHKAEQLIENGNLAIQQGLVDPQTLRQYGKAFENMDTVIMTAGMIFEQTNKDVAVSMMEYKKTGDDADLANAILKMEARNEMAETISGFGTNAGRALNQMKTIKKLSGQRLQDAMTQIKEGRDKKQLAAMVSQITTNFVELARPKKKGFTTRLETIQKKLAERFSSNDGSMSDSDVQMLNELFANTNLLEMTAQIKTKTRYQRGRDMVIDSTISGMLTGLSTHIVNTISGGANMAIDICDRLFAGGMYGKGSVLNGRADARAMLSGMYLGLGDAMYAAKRAFKTGQSQFADQNEKGGLIDRGVSKENAYMLLHGVEGHLSKEQIEALGGMQGISKIFYNSIDAVGGLQKKLSSHTMLTSDEFLRTMSYSMYRQMYAERARKTAEAQGLDGQAAYQEVVDGKNMAVHEEIMEATRYLVFQDPINPDSGWQDIDNFRKKHPESMLVMPFLKTPLNIAKFVGTRTPGIARLFSEYRQIMSNEGDMQKKQLAESRMLTGSMIWHAGLLMAASGLITGAGPADDKERELLYNTGWRPNSLHIGDKYYEFTRLDPVATFFSTIASFVEIASDLDHTDASEVAAATMGAALQVVSEKYYLTGVTDVLLVFRDVERYGGSYAARQISNLVPFSGARRMLTRGTDPIMREARGLIDAVRKDTPLASHAAAARRTILGETVKYEGGALGRAFSPVKTGTDKHDPVYDELHRLAENKTLSVSKPQRWFRSKDKSYKLNSHQYSKYLELSGTGVKIGGLNAKQRLEKLIKSPQYRVLNDEQQALLIEKIVRTYRQRAKEALISSDKELTEFYDSSRQQRSPHLAALL